MSNGGTSTGSGIITRRYKHGSIVYFVGDRSEFIYILKSGKVLLSSIKVETGEELKEDVKPGEFFGVKSALGKYPREETAQIGGDTVLLVLTLSEFERLVLKNVNVVLKMLRVFSNQLRRIGRAQREVLGEGEGVNPAVELFKIGEYYYKAAKFQQAMYAYKRYMEYYPDTQDAGKAMQRIKAIESGTAEEEVQPGGLAEEPAPAEVKKKEDVDMTDFSIEEPEPRSRTEDDMEFGTPGKAKSPLADEMDDFLTDNKTDEVDDFSFGEEPSSEAKKPLSSGGNIAEKFYKAMSLFSQEEYGDALALYEEILKFKTLKDESEKKIFEKANFEVGRCFLKLGRHSEALNALTNMIKIFPKSENVKNALFHIGMVFEQTRQPDKAITYYNKVAAMEPKDPVNKQALKRIADIQSGQR